MHAAVDYLETKRFVCLLRIEAVDPCIRCHLAASQRPGPFLGGRDELCAGTHPAMRWGDIPAFEMGSQGGVGEAHQRARRLFGDEDRVGQFSRPIAGNVGGKLGGVLGDSAIRPQGMCHRREAGEVVRLRAPYTDSIHADIIPVSKTR